MSKPLDELYLEWLYGQVASVKLKNPARTYWTLLRTLYSTEFVWLVANDDNRLEDGRDLRHDFIADQDIDSVEDDWLTIGCSMFEMLLALAKRLVFEADGNTEMSDWFWHLLGNINLANYNDATIHTDLDQKYIDHVLESVIWRNYQPDGLGGLFPLNDPHEDQRSVELWYQLSNYLLEGHTV